MAQVRLEIEITGHTENDGYIRMGKAAIRVRVNDVTVYAKVIEGTLRTDDLEAMAGPVENFNLIYKHMRDLKLLPKEVLDDGAP